MSDIYADLGIRYDEAMEAMGIISEKNQLLYDVNVELKSKLNQITSAWESTGEDRQSFVRDLERQVRSIESLVSTLGQLKLSINNYLENVKTISSGSM